MIPFENLLAPVRDDAPCGDDPAISGVLFELETAVQGKPETQFSPAEEPEWKSLAQRAQEVALTTKDLRVAGILSAALLRTKGVPGLADGVQLMRRYLEQFWPGVYPLLDATENNDPSERINALGNLAAPLATDGDALKILAGLRKVPLVVAPRAGRFTLEHYLAAHGAMDWPASQGDAPSHALLEAALKEADPASVAEVADAAKNLLTDLAAIESLFKATAGPSLYPSFEPLRRELKHVVNWLNVAAPEEQASQSPGTTEASSGGPAAAGASLSGVVRNREDVVRALDAVINYYKAEEPSSPVPFILGRVQKIVHMNFMQLITELTPESLDRIIALTGPVDQSGKSDT